MLKSVTLVCTGLRQSVRQTRGQYRRKLLHRMLNITKAAEHLLLEHLRRNWPTNTPCDSAGVFG